MSRVVASTLPPEQATPQSHGLSVHRVYLVSAEDPSLADTQASGSEIDVQVEINADADYRYVQLEDPLPAGCEVISADTDNGAYPLELIGRHRRLLAPGSPRQPRRVLL